jgi:TM2 domain-containing membrane protein YozV
MTTPPGQPPRPDPERPQPEPGWQQPPSPGYGQQPGYPQPQYGQPGYGPPGQTGPGYGPPGQTGPGYGPPGQTGPGYGPPGQTGPGYGPPGQTGPGYGDPTAPYGYDPLGRPYSDKQKLVAGLLGIFLGTFGVGRFYTGHTNIGIAQLAVGVLTCGLGGLWGLIDGIMILINGGTDADGRPLRD